jgi:DNA-binding NtrC family response regulator
MVTTGDEPVIRNLIALDCPGGISLAGLIEALRRGIGERCVVHQVATKDELLASLRSGFPYQLALVELEHGDGAESGPEIMAALRRIDAEIPVIAISDHGNIESAKLAMTAGATDFFVVGGERLQERLETLLVKLAGFVRMRERTHSLEEENLRLTSAEKGKNRIIGRSPEIALLREQIQRVASVPRPVLIVGERGTGKELVAREIHEAGGYGSGPFIAVNCAAFPDTLLESELFGHEKGAFTGADSRHRGRFEQANGGTLFLDEIGFMSLPFQQKILRTVEYGVMTRVGGTEEVRTTARVVAATNADLRERMKNGEFLHDLYDRLAFEVLHVPPLRERQGDIELLAKEFLLRFMQEIPAFRGKVLSRAAVEGLCRYDFPGNVRELKNIIERAAYRDTTNEISPADIDLPLLTRGRGAHGGFHEQVEALKASLIQDALEAAGGNQAAAARHLGLTYHQFRHFFRKFTRSGSLAT